MGVMSGAAVAVLLFDLFDLDGEKMKREYVRTKKCFLVRVLDLCCAPSGLKLCVNKACAIAGLFVALCSGIERVRNRRGEKRRYNTCSILFRTSRYMLADMVSPNSLIEGVEISQQRISLCNFFVRKYHIDTSPQLQSTIRMYCTDGTKFDTNGLEGLVFDSTTAREEYSSRSKQKQMNKSARAREKRRLLELQKQQKTAEIGRERPTKIRCKD